LASTGQLLDRAAGVFTPLSTVAEVSGVNQRRSDMFGYLSDFERTFTAVDELRRRMERVLGDVDADALATDTQWPRTNVYDSGQALVLTAEVPGLRDKDIDVSLNQEVLTLSGQRKVETPQGFAVHRQERRPARFSRTFTLPCKVQSEGLSAELHDGILTVRLPKAPEAQPRKIAVKAL
jgi:HSP20 family protein